MQHRLGKACNRPAEPQPEEGAKWATNVCGANATRSDRDSLAHGTDERPSNQQTLPGMTTTALTVALAWLEAQSCPTTTTWSKYG